MILYVDFHPTKIHLHHWWVYPCVSACCVWFKIIIVSHPMLLFLEAHIIICAGKTWQGNNFVRETPLSAGKLSHCCCFNSPLRSLFFGFRVSHRTCRCRLRELDRSIEVDEGQWWQRMQSKNGGSCFNDRRWWVLISTYNPIYRTYNPI